MTFLTFIFFTLVLLLSYCNPPKYTIERRRRELFNFNKKEYIPYEQEHTTKPITKDKVKTYEDKLILNNEAVQWVEDHPYGEGPFKFKSFISANKYTFWDTNGNIRHNKTPSLRPDPTIPKR